MYRRHSFSNRQGRKTASGERFTAKGLALASHRKIRATKSQQRHPTGKGVRFRQARQILGVVNNYTVSSVVTGMMFHRWGTDNAWGSVADFESNG